MARFRSVLITGASSGIGQALALACAAPGVTLHLCGRDAARLKAVATACRARGAAAAAPAVCDVRDAAAMAEWIGAAGPLDLVVANAGIAAGHTETPEQTRAIFATNLDGVLNTVLPALEQMAGQPPGPDGLRGRIAVIASIAAFVRAADAPAYCASKAAADAWTVASAPSARRRGVVLTSVCPGFIRSPMTAGRGTPMPGLMDAARAAAIILRGVAKGRARVAFPWWMAAGARLAGLLPASWMAGRPRATGE
ncbi:MAG TPA: SDR family NAD(P)-dependent oxidoreductase [Acetobacteraceae bacterium]|nr:SDR family NAD(P)-dependent oxidoreductase [Acetobacteraceae bacterium]